MPVTDEYNDDDDRDHAQAMIDWLADKDPDVWFEVTPHLNWDNAGRVVDWIVSQPRCDKANAASIFWGADPLYHLRNTAPGRKPDQESLRLIRKVVRNWRAGFYRRAELAWNEDWGKAHRDAVAARPLKDDPLSIPKDLLGPLKGRAPNVPKELRAQNNVALYDLLYALGTDVGWRPGSPEWRERQDPKWQRRQQLAQDRAAILQDAKDNLRFWLRSLPWLALLFVVMVGGAFLLRWINKGVLL